MPYNTKGVFLLCFMSNWTGCCFWGVQQLTSQLSKRSIMDSGECQVKLKSACNCWGWSCWRSRYLTWSGLKPLKLLQSLAFKGRILCKRICCSVIRVCISGSQCLQTVEWSVLMKSCCKSQGDWGRGCGWGVGRILIVMFGATMPVRKNTKVAGNSCKMQGDTCIT